MKKIVTTSMADKSVIVSVETSDDVSVFKIDYDFPFEIVNPRIALQIATLLVSDPTIPQNDVKE